MRFSPNKFLLSICFSALEGERSVFTGVLDLAAGGGGEHPSGQTHQVSLRALHMLATYFPHVCTHQRVFLPASGASAGGMGKPALSTLPLSALMFSALC